MDMHVAEGSRWSDPTQPDDSSAVSRSDLGRVPSGRGKEAGSITWRMVSSLSAWDAVSWSCSADSPCWGVESSGWALARCASLAASSSSLALSSSLSRMIVSSSSWALIQCSFYHRNHQHHHHEQPWSVHRWMCFCDTAEWKFPWAILVMGINWSYFITLVSTRWYTQDRFRYHWPPMLAMVGNQTRTAWFRVQKANHSKLIRCI